MNDKTRSRFGRAGAVLGGLLCILPSLTALGDEPIRIPTTLGSYQGLPEPGSVASELGLTVDEGQVSLTLEQAIALALNRNLTLVVQRYQRSQSVLAVERNQGIYDINVSGTGAIQEDTTPSSSVLVQADIVTDMRQQLNVQVDRLVPSGGLAQINLNNFRVETSDRANFFNPRFILGLDFQFSQPLLRNLGRDVTERNLMVARTDAAISREDFQNQVETIIQQASDSYWNLVESIQQLSVAEESLALAKELDRMNRIQVEVGTQAPLEVVTSEARVAARQQDIIRLRAQVEDNADELRRLANLDRGPLWSAVIVPVTPPEVEHQAIDFEEAVETALKNRTDVRRRRLQNETLELDARVARNQKKPQLDVSATYGYNAVDGDLSGVDPDTGEPVVIEPADYFDTFEQILDRQFDGWTLGFQFAYPLGNRAAKAASAAAYMAVEQGEYQLRDLELQILTDVRSAARAVETAAEEIESARVSSNLQQKNLEAEQKRYENGLVTSFQVLEIQEDVSEAKRIEVSAVLSYRRAEVAYYRAIGTLLDRFSVTLSDDEAAP